MPFADTSPRPHGALMDGIYRYQRHVYDVTRRYYLFGRDEMLAELMPPHRGAVLEIGCGTGRNLVHAARRSPDVHFHGIDLSAEMLKTARATIRRCHLDDRIALRQGDATDFDGQALFGRRRFDRVYFSYTLSMVPAWEAALETAVRHVAPGGSLHVVDFGQCENLPPLVRRALFAWLDRFHVTPRENLRAALEGLAGRNGGTLRFEPLMGGYAWHGVVRLAP
jgi:S-adenosylmethionine-diacylgycerolhomoserine-N-methlytransferase